MSVIYSSTQIVQTTANPWETNIGSSVQVDVYFAPIDSTPTPTPTPHPISPNAIINTAIGGATTAFSILGIGLVKKGKIL
jgi:hypothetical protein